MCRLRESDGRVRCCHGHPISAPIPQLLLLALLVTVPQLSRTPSAVAQTPDTTLAVPPAPASSTTLMARTGSLPEIDVPQRISTVQNDAAFLRQVFGSADSGRFESGAEAYLRLISSGTNDPADRDVVLRHLKHALDVMPPADRPEAGAAEESLIAAGEKVAAWWRRQDPFPITARNERLEEHLSRWGIAITEYENEWDERGYDDRGEIYIRFGPPGEHIKLRTDESRRAYGISNSLVLPEFPDSEIWVYRHVHEEAYYFFARQSRRAGYRLAHPSESIPSRLSAGLDYRNMRGRQKTDVLLLLMEEVYAQLALAHPIFGPTYDEIAHYRVMTRPALSPDAFARSALAGASSLEMESAGRRNKLVPASFSGTRGVTEDLPVHTRWARFLEPDGTTRTEIYWSLDTQDLAPSRRLERTLTDEGHTPTEKYLITVTVARLAADFRQEDVQSKHYLVDSTRSATPRAQVFSVHGDTGNYNVVAQWSQHWTQETLDGRIGEGAMLKLATLQLDTLIALHGTAERFEMSDLKPVFPYHSEIPYPFERVNPSSPPDLYFELYNLHYGEDDRTRYTIEYEVAPVGPDGDVRSDLTTRARTTSVGTDRTARERIGVDLEEWRRGTGKVMITVRATDEVTFEQVARSLIFVVEP